MHTITAKERAWKLRVRVACALTAALELFLLFAYAPQTAAEIVGAGLGLMLLLGLATHCARGKTSVGMLPLFVLSLGFTAFACHLWPLAALGALVSLFLVVNFIRMWLAYARVQTPEQLSAAIVLGCAVKEGRPSHTLELRLQEALKLSQVYPSALLVLTGGISEGEQSEASIMQDFLRARGIAQERMIVEDEALNTEQNIEFSLERLHELKADSSVGIITSDYHLLRTLEIGREAGYELVPFPAKTPAANALVQWTREVLVIYDRYLKRAQQA